MYDVLLVSAVGVLDTDGLMNLVCYHSSQNVMNFQYFQPVFRLMNWNVQQNDYWFARNCIRPIDVADELDLFALRAAAAAVGRIKYPKKYLMNPRKIAVQPERIAIGIDLVIVAVETMMMMRMIRDQMKKQKSKNSITNKNRTNKQKKKSKFIR